MTALQNTSFILPGKKLVPCSSFNRKTYSHLSYLRLTKVKPKPCASRTQSSSKGDYLDKVENDLRPIKYFEDECSEFQEQIINDYKKDFNRTHENILAKKNYQANKNKYNKHISRTKSKDYSTLKKTKIQRNTTNKFASYQRMNSKLILNLQFPKNKISSARHNKSLYIGKHYIERLPLFSIRKVREHNPLLSRIRARFSRIPLVNN